MFVIRLRSLILYILIFVFLVTSAFVYFDAFAEWEEIKDVELPILMYHAICDGKAKEGKFVITKEELEKDLKYLKDEGYTTISSAELIEFVENGTPLPEKPIMLTFDDGYYNNYCYAFPLLKKYNAKAIISIIGKHTDMYSEISEDNPAYSHITWDQAREMIESGLIEIQNHSYDSHTTDRGRNGTKKKKGETQTAYREYIHDDIGRLQEEIKENLGYTPMVFTYPFGSISEASCDILKEMGFKMTLSCAEKVSKIKAGDHECLYRLGRYLRANKISAEKILNKIK